MLGYPSNSGTNVRYVIIRNMFVVKLPMSVPLLGGRTISELLAITILVLIGLVGAMSGEEGSGSVASMLGFLLILTGLRYNLLGFFLGISFERALFWHKVLACITLFVSIVHGVVAGFTDPSGLLLILFMLLASLIYAIKHYIFEAFYYLHIGCNIALIPFALAHEASIMALGSFIWALDLIFRYGLSTSRVEALLEVLPADVIRISYPKANFNYNAGQYCFIMIPELSMFEFHPFTISSSPHEPEVKFHIRVLGNWTKALHEYVASKATMQENGIKGFKMTINVEGPFGIPSVDFENEKVYKAMLLVTGGIGVTPAQSLFNHFVHQFTKGSRDIRKCIFLWSVKDRAMLESIDETRTDTKSILPHSFQPNLLDFDGPVVADDAEKQSGSVPEASSSIVVHPTSEYQGVELTEAGAENISISKSKSFSFHHDQISSVDPFHVEFNLTSCRNEEDFAKAGIDPENQPHVKFGRPDLPAKWKSVAEMCVKENIKRVAVLVCGPAPMVRQVQELCSSAVTLTVKNNDGLDVSGSVLFDLHMEEFDF